MYVSFMFVCTCSGKPQVTRSPGTGVRGSSEPLVQMLAPDLRYSVRAPCALHRGASLHPAGLFIEAVPSCFHASRRAP